MLHELGGTGLSPKCTLTNKEFVSEHSMEKEDREIWVDLLAGTGKVGGGHAHTITSNLAYGKAHFNKVQQSRLDDFAAGRCSCMPERAALIVIRDAQHMLKV